MIRMANEFRIIKKMKPFFITDQSLVEQFNNTKN